MSNELKELTSLSQVSDFISSFPKLQGFIPELVDSGVSTAVYRLRGRSKTFYLRLGGSDENMSSEVLAHRLILDKGVYIPTVVMYGDDDQRINRSFMITSEIPGIRADKDPKTTGDIFFEAGKQLGLINSIPVEGFGWINRHKLNVKKLSGTYKSWGDFALNTDNIKSQLDTLTSFGIIDDKKRERIQNYIKENIGLIICPQAYLSHGDFDISHIFSVAGRYSGIIDFGDIRCCSQYHDLSHFFTFTPKYFNKLLEGYLTINKLEGDILAKVKFEAILFGISKLHWWTQYLPQDITPDHPVIALFSTI